MLMQRGNGVERDYDAPRLMAKTCIIAAMVPSPRQQKPWRTTGVGQRAGAAGRMNLE
jgi:hypothetical protein